MKRTFKILSMIIALCLVSAFMFACVVVPDDDKNSGSNSGSGSGGSNGGQQVAGNGGTTLQFLSPFLWRAPHLEMRRERREFFPTTQGKDPSSRARRRKPGSSGCGRDSRASSRVETGMSGNFLSCSKGVKDPLEVPEVRCD